MKEKVKDVLSFLARAAFSLLLLMFVFSKIDIEKTKEVIATADKGYIFYGMVVFFLIYGILLLRWFIFIRALDLVVSPFTAIRYYFIGLFGNLFLASAIGGDLIKIYGLCKETHQKAKVVASILLDRLSGFAAIAIVAVCAYSFGFRYIEDKSLLLPIVVMASFSLCVAAVLFNEKIYSFGCKIFNGLPKVKKSLMSLHYDVALLKGKRKEGFKAIAISCLSQCIFSFNFCLIAKALHQDISLIYFLIFVPLICVAAAFPSIGGLGVREAGAAYLFSKIGVDAGVAVSMSLINFLFMVLGGLIGGAIYVSTFSSRRIQCDSPDADTVA